MSALKGHHAPSLLPAGKKWELVWHDEFDGPELDRGKWDFRLHLMQQRHNTFTTEGVYFDGESNIHLQLVEKDGQYYSPHLQTGYNYMDLPPRPKSYGKFTWPIGELREHKFLHKFGYYECRCKLHTQPGWWPAFWLQSPTIGSSLDPAHSGVEVDIMECFDPVGGLIEHTNHWNGYATEHKFATGGRLPLENPRDFHHYGVDWSPAGYVFYIDGKETWRLAGPVSQREQFVMLSTECLGYREGDGPNEELRRAVLPDAFVVDFVRVYDAV